MTTIPAKITPGTLERLRKMACKAMDARDDFEAALEKCRKQPGWDKACKKTGCHPDANAGDWMC